MLDPLLTIGIPTYNRAAFLDRLLSQIVPACQKRGVAVLVSDNCSTDQTAAIIDKYRGFDNFKAVRNVTNIGFDRNLLNIFANAAGQFLWLFGDDDELEVDQLDNILHLLAKNYDVGMLYLAHQFIGENNPAGAERVQLAFEMLTQQQYVDTCLHKATLISTNIINLKYYKKINLDPRCFGLGWVQLHIFLRLAAMLAKEGGKNIRIKNYIVRQGVGNTQYAFQDWVRLFVDNFIFTINVSSIEGLVIRRLLKNFYLLNIRRRFYRVAKEICLNDAIAFYQKCVSAFPVSIVDKLLYFPVCFIVRGLVRFQAMKNDLMKND